MNELRGRYEYVPMGTLGKIKAYCKSIRRNIGPLFEDVGDAFERTWYSIATRTVTVTPRLVVLRPGDDGYDSATLDVVEGEYGPIVTTNSERWRTYLFDYHNEAMEAFADRVASRAVAYNNLLNKEAP